MCHQLISRRKRKEFALCLKDQVAHILPANTESTTVNAGYHLKISLTTSQTFVTHPSKTFDPGDLIPGCPIISSDLCFDHDGRIEFIWDEEVGRLVIVRKSLGAFFLAERDSSASEVFLF